MLYFKIYDLLRHTKVKAQAIETVFRATAAENSVENHMDYVEANSLLQRTLLHLSEQQRTVYHLVKKKKALAMNTGG